MIEEKAYQASVIQKCEISKFAVVTAKNKEEAIQLLKNGDWDDCIDEEELNAEFVRIEGFRES